MIWLTGDLHRDFTKLDKFNLYLETKYLSKPSKKPKDFYLIVCGDFGGVWYGGFRDEVCLKRFDNYHFTTLFVDGNHENFDALDCYPIEEFNGGLVNRITPKVFRLKRSQVFNIEGKKIFTLGGASSIDKVYRIPHISWWSQENFSLEDYDNMLKQIEYNPKVDYIITHDAPTSIVHKISEYFITDTNNDVLEELDDKMQRTLWYFGHYHIDRCFHTVDDDGELKNTYMCLYNEFVKLGSTKLIKNIMN